MYHQLIATYSYHRLHQIGYFVYLFYDLYVHFSYICEQIVNGL